MSDPSTLETPLLLLAMPQVQDPFFHKSVVLLVHFEEGQGSLGFIVNRPLELTIAEILEDLEISWQGDPEARAFFGGPVSSEMGTLVYRESDLFDGSGEESASADAASADAAESPDGDGANGAGANGSGRAGGANGSTMSFSQSVGDLDLVAHLEPGDYRLFFGYAGWGEGQLEEEILRNDWLIAPAREDLIFCDDPETAWRQAVQSVGIDPDQLPAWTSQEHDFN